MIDPARARFAIGSLWTIVERHPESTLGGATHGRTGLWYSIQSDTIRIR
jgi:hypothetical protein